MSTSLSSETMMKLMAYADGELEGKERLDAEKLLATDEHALRFVEQISGCGNLVGEGYEDSKAAKTVASFDIADAVMAQVKKEKPEPKGEAAPKSEVAPKSTKISPIELARAKRAQRMKIGGGIVAALAIAAAVFVYARPSETPMAKGPSTVPNNPTQTSSNGPGVDVTRPGENVNVFYLPSANELGTSVIIWVDESSAEKK